MRLYHYTDVVGYNLFIHEEGLKPPVKFSSHKIRWKSVGDVRITVESEDLDSDLLKKYGGYGQVYEYEGVISPSLFKSVEKIE